ncbi:glycosyltransferase family 2 protein [Chryseosolibacter indicus]|uniref:Glycosyltransferase n=1 Tax=Chryseosolibacter indicus TaxID=2782351 RepID=A0ABS5VKR5_9BACT|nr:glycosyltransferase [Chryseosolibacter indicus]MBT1702039.1 glycosyltransferase [Chryseosolibacter indicus]
MSPLVSIIIPAYNSERYIADTLDSVRSQIVDNYEVIVVDDGSTDNQKSIILNYVKADNRFKYIFQNNKGVSAARNAGYSISKGFYIAFLDADDVWMPDNLGKKINKFKENNFGLVHSNALMIDDKSNEREGIILKGKEGYLLDDLLLWNGTQIPGPSSILVKREVLEEVGLFDENLSTSADQDFFFRVAAKFKIGRVNEITWKYRWHDHNMHKNILLMERDVQYVYRKALKLNLFKTNFFKRKSFSNMYLILAASWVGDGKNYWKGVCYLLKSIATNPLVVIHIIKRIYIRIVSR